MSLTDYHAKYFAHELTKRFASGSVEKLAPVLADAQVDLNPHQVEAALFAFRSSFAKGATLADELGLGETIEAGLLIAQKPERVACLDEGFAKNDQLKANAAQLFKTTGVKKFQTV